MMPNISMYSQSIRGIVPVQYPKGGSGVDGDAFANISSVPGVPGAGVGDLFCNPYPANPSDPPETLPAGTGGCVVGPDGIPYDPTRTFAILDRYENDLTIFTMANKIDDNPNSYTWGAGNNPPKNEIQNCGASFSYGSASVQSLINGVAGPYGNPDDLWCLFAGDRKEVNGSSYIDFEFLQKSLTITGAVYGNPNNPFEITGGSGGFVSAASNLTGGRTPGDILVTIEFDSGGNEANVSIRRWTLVGAVYMYVIVPNSTYTDPLSPNFGTVFITNNTAVTNVPYDVFGVQPGQYAVNQWAEGAVNLSKIFGAIGGESCFKISTLFIRTRSSGSSNTSELKDFPGAPIQLSLCTDTTPPVINAPASPIVLQGCNPDWPNLNADWTDNCAAGGNIAGVPGQITTDGCTQSRDYTFDVSDGCGNSDHKVVHVSRHYDVTAPVIVDKPDVILAGCNTAWPEVVSTTYTDNCDAAGSVNGVAGDVQTSQDGCTQYRDYTFNFTDSCTNAALQQVTRVSRHYDVTAPVIVDKPDYVLAGCNPAWPEVVSTTYTDNCDAAGSVNGIAGAVQTSQDGCTQYRDYTFNFTDSCSNAALQQVTRVSRHYDVTAPVIVDKPDVILAGCNPAWPEVVSTTYTDNCDAAGS
ncbi:hypothetical protein, partial [Flavobacterium sp.]|uniref:hypothetical protein n=1 Tax=Flavobacterium sp. TaxID=239 RepID=UPI00260FE9D1